MKHIYVTLPEYFVAVPNHSGYFYNIHQHRLYSIKVNGILTPLKKEKPSHWNKYRSGYRISIKGQKMWLTDDFLHKLKPKQTIIPIRGK